jgi:hypothetical protein
VRVGIAAAYVDRLAGCREALWRVVRHGREGGAVTSAIDALFLLGNHGFLAGQWEEVAQVCDEGLRLCDAHSYRLLAWPGLFLQALLAATRGDDRQTQALTDQMTRWAAPRRIGSVQHYAAHAKALAALGRGDFEDAYQHATAVSAAGVLAANVPHALWLVMDLVEAAMRTGRHAEAATHVAAVREADLAAISPRLALVTGGSAAIVGPDHRAGDLFEQALPSPAPTDGRSTWPGSNSSTASICAGLRPPPKRAATSPPPSPPSNGSAPNHGRREPATSCGPPARPTPAGRRHSPPSSARSPTWQQPA